MALREDFGGNHEGAGRTSSAPPAVWLQSDQLSSTTGPLAGSVPGSVDVVLVESMAAVSRLPFHKKKLVLRFSAMRHFARELTRAGHRVWYYAEHEDDSSALRDFASRRGAGELLIEDSGIPGEPAGKTKLAEEAGFRTTVHPPRVALLPFERFRAWLDTATAPNAETFVEELAVEMKLRPLPTPSKPVMTALPKVVPPLPIFPRDSVTREVVEMVERRFPKNFGTAEGFNLPVNRSQVLELVDHFLVERLPLWSSDGNRPAMSAGEPFLCQSIVDPYLGLGLVSPRELAERVREGVASGEVLRKPAEIFLERVLAGREYLLLFRRARPESDRPEDSFGHRQELPAFLSATKLPMNCLADTLKQIRHHGFAPNAQRNLLIGNLLVLAETDPSLVQEWCDAAFLDSTQRPVRPSLLGSNPGEDELPQSPTREICDHSNYCTSCNYDPDQLAGEDACPYNPLFWDFLDRNRAKAEQIPRLAASLRVLDSFDPGVRDQIREAAAEVRQAFVGGNGES